MRPIAAHPAKNCVFLHWKALTQSRPQLIRRKLSGCPTSPDLFGIIVLPQSADDIVVVLANALKIVRFSMLVRVRMCMCLCASCTLS